MAIWVLVEAGSFNPLQPSSSPRVIPFDQPDPIIEVLDPYVRDGALGPAWNLRSAADQPWLSFQRPGERGPEQGWKLHVSSTIRSAATVLARALPVLLSEQVPFKVASSCAALASVNGGGGGLSQVGKFITVYPGSDEQAVRVAAALDAETRGLGGPKVPSDRPLAPDSLVHYRYGAFGTRLLQRPWGETCPALLAPNGELVPDIRETEYRPPDWVHDPFVAAGIAAALPPPEDRIGGRYLPMGRLSQSPRGSVFLAVDVVTPRRCIVKEAMRHALVDRSGADACDRLRNEARMLRRVGGDPRFPTLLDVVETARGLALVMEDIEGMALDERVCELARSGRFLPVNEVLRMALEVAELVAVLHRQGIVFRDLKPANVMVASGGSLRLIDFELAQDLSSCETVPGMGTRGYMSPQQVEGKPVSVSDDVHGYGALLWFLVTAIEPGRIPRHVERVGSLGSLSSLSSLSSLIETINPGLPEPLLALVSSCLSPAPEARPPSMQNIALELRGTPAARRVVEPPALDTAALERLRTLVRGVGDSLCALAEPALDDGLRWRSREGSGKTSFHRDINSGTAGVLLALAEVVDAFGEERHTTVLARAASWLRRAPRPPEATSAGLYVGEAGVGAALLRAGLALDDDELIEAAAERGRWVAEQPLDSPDLFNGVAGRLRFHLALAMLRDDGEHLDIAHALGDWLVHAATPAEAGGCHWRIPPGYGSMSGTAMLGYAHGAAGIADALLDLFETTGDRRWLDTARGAAVWIEHLAEPALDDEDGVDWPVDENNDASKRIGPFWCHGAAGIARFLARAATMDLIPSAMGLAQRAALTVGRGSGWSAMCQCHGVLGSIEMLVDVHQASGDPRALRLARPLVDLVVANAVQRQGGLVWPFDSPASDTPDLMVGFSGVAPCLLRVIEADRRPHLLSLGGLTRSASSSP